MFYTTITVIYNERVTREHQREANLRIHLKQSNTNINKVIKIYLKILNSVVLLSRETF